MNRAGINIPMTARIIAVNAYSIPWLTAASLIPIDKQELARREERGLDGETGHPFYQLFD